MKARPNADGKSTLGLCYILLNPGRFLMIPLCGRGIGAGLNFLECGNRTRKGPSVYKTCRWHVFSEERRDGPHTLACGSSSQQRFEETLVDSRHLHQGLHPRQFAIITAVVVATFFARVFTCGRIAVLRSKMGVFQTPKQFLPGVD